MNNGSIEEFVSKAIGHAKEHWCLDDEAVVREWCESGAGTDTPEALVDERAMRYGLMRATDKVGAVRGVRQLLAEYKDVIGKELREAVLSKLPS